MFKLFLRDVLTVAVLMALLAGAVAVLGLPTVASPPAMPWSLEEARLRADPVLLARDGALLLFALATLVALLRVLISGLYLLSRDYPAVAHLAEVLAGRLVRRAGALAGVMLAVLPGIGTVRASAPSRQAAPGSSLPRVTSVYLSVPPLGRRDPGNGLDQVPRHRAALHAARRWPMRRVGLALRYVVQPEDTLDDVAVRFGLPDWRPIMQATRGVPQPVGGPITDPDLIYPGQILHIPLPVPALKVSDGHVFYVVQQGDTLSGIAARFLGDWRLFRQIGNLNRGVHQPDGGALEDDNLILPGWVLRIPQEFVIAQPDGTAVTHRIIVHDLRPARLRRGIRPRRPEVHPSRRGARPVQVAACTTLTTVPPARVRVRPVPVLHARRHHGQSRAIGSAMQGHDARKPPMHPRVHHGLRLRPRRPQPIGKTHDWSPGHRRDVHPAPVHVWHLTGSQHRVSHPVELPVHTPRAPRPGGHTLPTPRPVGPASRSHRFRAHPVYHIVGRRAIRPTHHRLVPRRRAPARLRPVGRTLPRPAHGPSSTRPLVHVPDLHRELPVAFVVGFLVFAIAAAASRRRALQRLRGRRGGVAVQQWGGRLGALAPSVRRTLHAALNGVEGRLVRALHRTSVAVTGGARAAHVVATLDRIGHEVGITSSLAGATRLLVEDIESMQLVVEVPRLPSARVDEVVSRLGTALGVPVSATRGVDRDGTPIVTLILETAALTAPAEVRPHPAPLLVPVGATANGGVLHLNLGRTGGLLVAGNGQSLAATLLASTVYQAPPDTLRLLVASDDDELRKALPQLDHLDAPPADARDPHAVANLIAQAHTLVLERYERYGASATAASSVPPAPPVPCLLFLAGIEGLPDEALDRLDAVAHTGAVCGVHLLATTSDPPALAASGMLSLFRTRLARRMAPVDHQLIFPDADIGALGSHPQEVLLYGLGPQQLLRAFMLAPPEVREVFATVAVATPPPLPAVDVPEAPPPSSPPTPPPAPAPAEGESDEPGDGAAAGEAPPPVSDGNTGNDAMEMEEDHAPAGAATTAAADPRPAGPPVRIEVLGGITVYVHGQPAAVFPRERGLLAALAVMGPRPVRRGDLIEALFADDEDGGATLSRVLSDLRAALRAGGLPREQARDLVVRSSGGYSLHQDLVEVDLWQVDALLERAEGLDEEEAAPLRVEAFTRYHGPPCEGETLDFVGEHGFRWMKRVAAALQMLSEHYREAGDLKSALHWAHRLVAEEPCNDHANQLVMNLLAETGDAEALDAHVQEMQTQYAACRQKIDPYTLRLYEQLRRKLSGASKPKAG